MGERTQDLLIRAASLADLPDLARHFRCQAEAVLPYAVAAEIVSEPDWYGYARDRLADPSTRILTAVEAGAAIGSIELRFSHAESSGQASRRGLKSVLYGLLKRSSGRSPTRVIRRTGVRARLEHIYVEPESDPLLFRKLVHAAQATAIDLGVDILDADLAAANVRLWRACNSLQFENERVLVSMRLDSLK